MICKDHPPRFQIGFIRRPPVIHRLAIPLQTRNHGDDRYVVRDRGPYRVIVLIARVRVAAGATQTIHDKVNPALSVEFTEGFGDGGSGTFEGAKAG